MAEEGAADGQEPKKGGAKLLIIVAAVVLVGIGGGAYFLGIVGGGDEAEAAKGGASHGQGDRGTAAAANDGAVAPLDSFVVNLADEAAQRYLKVTMKVEFFASEVPMRFTSRQAQIRDLVLTLLSSKTVDDVRTVEGKAQLRDEVIARINRVLDDDTVKAIYFAEFIVQ